MTTTTTTMMMVMTSTAGNSSEGWREANDNGTENRDQANNGITFARLIKRKKHTTPCHATAADWSTNRSPLTWCSSQVNRKKRRKRISPLGSPYCRKECHMWTNDSFPIISSVSFCGKHSPGGDNNGLGRWKSRTGNTPEDGPTEDDGSVSKH